MDGEEGKRMVTVLMLRDCFRSLRVRVRLLDTRHYTRWI